jgi:signal transduction histidine kinase
MKSWVRWTPEDGRRTRALWEHIAPRQREVADRFYDRILEVDAARAVFADEAQVERLKRSLVVWLREMLSGPWDDAYFLRRRRIGHRHVQVGLPHRFMFTAMSVVRDHLCELSHEYMSHEESCRTCEAVGRITNLDLAIMTGDYLVEHERSRLVSMQELILSNLPVHVLLIDDLGLVTTATQPTAWTPAEAGAIGKPWQDVLPPELLDAADLEAHVTRVRETGDIASLPRVDVDLEGRTTYFGVQVVPLHQPNAALMIHVEDLTFAVQTEAQLQSQATLAQIGAMSAGVAHELRNPLAGISGAVQVLSRAFPEDDRRGAILRKVHDQIRRLDRLVTDLLAFARPQAPKAEDVDLAGIAAQAAELVRDSFPEHDVVVAGTGSAKGDPDHVHRVLLNLGRNAAQAAEGSALIRFEVADGHVVVADNGPGIPPKVREHIYEPFFTTKTQGTGLGLAICQSSLSRMGGKLTLLDDHALGGAAFRIDLPFA